MNIAHLSDLHLGRGESTTVAARALVDELIERDPDLIVVSGDVTHRGRRSELEQFTRIFAPVAARLVVVPGNHDRLGDDVGQALMPGFRVQASLHEGAWVVRFDSTGPHNRRWLDGHGLLTAEDVSDCATALRAGPEGAPRILVMHHHPLPLPDEHAMEKLVTRLGWPNARELPLGAALIERLRGSCELVLHGHRHVPSSSEPHPGLRLISGGSSTELYAFRLLRLDAQGAFSERWAEAPRPLPSFTSGATLAAFPASPAASA